MSISRGLRRGQRFLRDEQGTITVEFVLWLPLIILLGITMFVISYYVATISEVQQVAHDAARSSFRYVNGGALHGDLCEQIYSEVMPGVVSRMAIVDFSSFTPMASCPSQPDASNYVTVSVTYDLSGSVLQSLGRMIGLDLGTITRSSMVQL